MVRLDAVQAADALLLATGAYWPLDGFMGERDYRGVLRDLHLSGGQLFPLPIVFAVPADVPAEPGDALTLRTPDGAELVMEVHERFRRHRLWEAYAVYRTADPGHPGVARLLQEEETCLAGPVRVVSYGRQHQPEPWTPGETRRLIAERGWRKVAAFQTRNPLHRAHEHLLRLALEQVDGLLLHPLVGPTKSDDVPADVRMACYRLTLSAYFPPDRVLLGLFPAAMRYAGPREALFHALVRRNYGASHFIVGRDAAGVADLYHPDEARELVERYQEELGIVPIGFPPVGYCPRCEAFVSARTCPHRPEWLELSGTALRAVLRSGGDPPRELVRPEIAAILREHFRSDG
jgi:sulfate adenylyltransferase